MHLTLQPVPDLIQLNNRGVLPFQLLLERVQILHEQGILIGERIQTVPIKQNLGFGASSHRRQRQRMFARRQQRIAVDQTTGRVASLRFVTRTICTFI